jgi:hypothetical protein
VTIRSWVRLHDERFHGVHRQTTSGALQAQRFELCHEAVRGLHPILDDREGATGAAIDEA